MNNISEASNQLSLYMITSKEYKTEITNLFNELYNGSRLMTKEELEVEVLRQFHENHSQDILTAITYEQR